MSDRTLSLDLPDALAEEVDRAARARGQTAAEFMAEAVVARLGSEREAAEYFTGRAERAKAGTARKFFTRTSGEPPRAGDEIE
jgi:predicted transcriptional regulator